MRSIALTLTLVSTLVHAEHPEFVEEKQPEIAVGASAGTTALGIGMLVWSVDMGIRPQAYPNGRQDQIALIVLGSLATLAGPSIGSFYADEPLNLGFALRALGLGAAAVGSLAAYELALNNDLSGTLLTFGLGTVMGALTYLVGATIEIARLPAAVRRFNESHASSLVFAPTVIPTRDGMAPGFAWAGRF